MAKKQAKKFKHWSSIDVKKTLDEASKTVLPDGLTQRQAFAQLMPEIQNLKLKGCSFEQIADLLKTLNFDLKAATVRNYYSECLVSFKSE